MSVPQPIIDHLHLKKSGNGYLGNCPCHPDNNPSLSVNCVNGTILLKCHAGCSQEKLIDYLRSKDLWLTKVFTREYFEEVWENAKTLNPKDIGWKYLKEIRGISNIENISNIDNVRFINSLEYFDGNETTKKNFPALIFAVHNQEDHLIGIQRIYLNTNGEKAPVSDQKKTLGKIKNGAIKLKGCDSELHLAEGPETALAILTSLNKPTWSSLNANNLVNTPVPESVQRLHIWADKDLSQTGEEVAIKAAEKFSGLGIDVIIHMPEGLVDEKNKHIDWLDILNQKGSQYIVEESILGSLYDLKIKELVNLADVVAEEVEWFWYPYIPKGKVTLLEGDPGLGKSWLSLYLAVATSLGSDLPDSPKREAANVLLLCAEDGIEDTIKPRLEAMGGDHTKIFAYQAPLTMDTKGSQTLSGILKKTKPALIIIDPLVAFLGEKTDMHRANEIRPIMTRLFNIATQYNCAILGIRHLKKSKEDKAIYNGLGSIDITASARSVLFVGKHPHKENVRGMAHIKSNLAPMGDILGFEIKDAKFEWTGKLDISLQDLLSADDSTNKNPGALGEAIDFLEAFLSKEPIGAIAIKLAAKEAGIKNRTLDRAKKELGIISKSEKDPTTGQKRWVWILPDFQDCQELHTGSMATLDNNAEQSFFQGGQHE
ncbi:MAG: hypothetical protein A2381_13510 [Bdellovibrionales bacterium RIFOXYB1_FULL_37_110]|nr:MAG: hypothetical protein A2417_08170 [Bdellovibrionales bacterium RIFOXYC1_FULL_37_79]OFZ59463.1 MAG: hypothetical protein A2381_13510 [Bdellovibrionales bacterium RIFOXYB1_FULL_37_110]OFZ64310.1 MAG: hypothetical protein A2577_02635 [Bdellovibrionales bacterium RIFOXYD1_FULL_36_51]